MNLTEFVTGMFLLPDGRLRAGWRLLLFVVVFVVGLFLFGAAAASFSSHRPIFFQTVILAASGVCATWLLMRFFERRSFRAVGLELEQGSGKQLGLGFLGGAGMVGTVTVVEWSLGTIQFQQSNSDDGMAFGAFFSMTAVLYVAASVEELLFRGYPFQRLVEGTNATVAIVLSSCFFGFVHLQNPHATWLGLLNTVLAGVLLSLAYLKTRSLWLPIGFHISWNWTMALVGLPVSGLEVFQMPWETIASAESAWLHGGAYGPEGGVLATGVLSVGIVYLLRMKQCFPARKAETPSPQDPEIR